MRLCVALCTVLFALFGVVTGGMAQPKQETSASAASKAADEAGSEDAKPAESAQPANPKTESEASATAPSAPGSPQQEARPGPSDAEAPAPAGVDGSTFIVKLRDLEQRIDELKEQIRRSHTRLSLLSDTILSGGVGGSRAEISFETDLSDAFRLTRVLVVLDGAVLYNKTDEAGGLGELGRIPIFSGSMPPGDHTVQVKIELRGHGYGVFSYLRGYTFKVEDTHSFTATEGKTVELAIYAYEKGGVTTPLEQRPNLRFVEKVTAGARAPAAKKGASATSVKTGGSASFGVGAP